MTLFSWVFLWISGENYDIVLLNELNDDNSQIAIENINNHLRRRRRKNEIMYSVHAGDLIGSRVKWIENATINKVIMNRCLK